MTTTRASETKPNGAYADVNGINLYYETHGEGRPVVVLHGGLGSGELFAPALPALAGRYRVIVPDLQGHGRTADIDRPIDPRLMANDIAALIGHLGLEKPAIVGTRSVAASRFTLRCSTRRSSTVSSRSRQTCAEAPSTRRCSRSRDR